jgi:hypothetical protein
MRSCKKMISSSGPPRQQHKTSDFADLSRDPHHLSLRWGNDLSEGTALDLLIRFKRFNIQCWFFLNQTLSTRNQRILNRPDFNSSIWPSHGNLSLLDLGPARGATS